MTLSFIRATFCLAAALAIAPPAIGCREAQELFPDREGGSGQPPNNALAPSTTFHLISIGANAQTDGTGQVNGLGAAILLRDQQVLFWGNGGEQTNGRGFAVAVIDPASRELIGTVENFDPYETKRTTTAETSRLVAFLDAVADGMLVLLVVGDDAGVTDNGTPSVLCNLLQDDDTLRLLDRLSALGSRQIRKYCYRASWAMAAYKGKGAAEQEALINGAPAHLTLSLP